MKKLGLLICLLVIATGPRAAAEEYVLGPDSQRQPGVPQGAVTHFTWTSKIFPGTVRDYWVYVPAQYSKDKPACVMVFQDGEGFIKEDGRARIPIVFDNLIAKHDMPVTIGIFINPGVLKALSPDQQDRFNRSFEYDGMGDRYARFLLDEILPEVAKQYNLSTSPDDRAISGLSSGGICAFNVAWNRPDAFRRVLSFIGSFTDLRGGDVFPSLIRKTEPKPLRVFLQDGDHDLNIYAGSWWLANQSVASALEWAGYDVKFVTGDKDHDMLQGGAILPDALRWLWRDYPQPIKKPAPNHSGDERLAILDPASDWELVPLGPSVHQRYLFDSGMNWIAGTWESHDAGAAGLTADTDGNIFFDDISGNRVVKIAIDGSTSTFWDYFPSSSQDSRGIMFGADGRLYACEGDRILAYGQHGHGGTIAAKLQCQDLAATHDRGIYYTDPAGHEVWYVDHFGHKHKSSFPGLEHPNGVRLSPDQSLLFVSDPNRRWIWSFQIQPDGTLRNVEPFYHLESRDDTSSTGASGMTVDTLGHLYVATRLGVQVCDQPGRVVAIISPPAPGPMLGVAFGGADLQYLYVDVGNKIYRRHMLRKGVLPWVPVKPPVPHL
ncbi:MAG TPA: SMP-30/gluconolactonase/LRE family protein [Terriglobia bacterium]|nr:SMP-30/gluconolactonase/LRE family protein [Terriglobia bacterium]